jgi:arginine-tRNA-protein transferase
MRQTSLFLGLEHPCGYLSQRSARNAYQDPSLPLDPERYGQLLAQGFRRGGDYVYRPYCQQCRACLSARVRLADFVPTRSQRRCWQKNQDLTLHITNRLTREHFELYSRYLTIRHPNEGMDPNDEKAFRSFLECSWGVVYFWEWRLRGRLLACAVIDEVVGALSAVYTFYDPESSERGLGTFAVLQQIENARSEGLSWLYLGYWVPESSKMDYKKHFQPLELWQTTVGWRSFEDLGFVR